MNIYALSTGSGLSGIAIIRASSSNLITLLNNK
jgi:tRNA U34 5-carboxymethylaminomethyl modifying GTPase MnmE/TrmE